MIEVIENNINNVTDEYSLQLITGIMLLVDELGKYLNITPGDYVDVTTTLEKCQRKSTLLMHK